MSKLSEIRNSWYPTGHDYLLDYFEDYDYRRCKDPSRLDYRLPDNWVGYQQRAFMVWYALEYCGKTGKVGLDIGSGGVFTPYCLSTDKYIADSHPDYGGAACIPQLKISGEDFSIIGEGKIPLILGNHVFEHLEGDAVKLLMEEWAPKLEQGGIIAQIVPDNAFCDVMAMDKSHKHAWSADTFFDEVLYNIDLDVLDIVSFNKLQNNFSFEFVLRKK